MAIAPSSRTIGDGSRWTSVEIAGLDDPEARDVLLGLQVGPVGEHRLAVPAVNDGGRARRRQPPAEDPVAVDRGTAAPQAASHPSDERRYADRTRSASST